MHNALMHRYITMSWHMSTSKVPYQWEDLDTYLLQSAQHKQTDRQTDHAMCNICSNRQQICIYALHAGDVA